MLTRLKTNLAGPRLPDADGTPRRLVTRLPSAEGEAAFQAVRSRLPQPPFASGRGRAISVALNIASTALLLVVAISFSRGIGTWLALAAVWCAAIGLFYDLRWHRRTIYSTTDLTTLRDAWLAERHCPACAHPLCDATNRPDHLYCPECGAVWRPGL